ncbi:hypothetical protein [Lysinibacter cavernae]|uniref:Uncharacterized protein n=1 Tax=Lysinibacter cavernae TaxID=1640652 RepID=A0A7X5R491_9MICO|nr:hypothetical protein [Lysinibacter cavernae]NIH55286.1 hypothetical protein [Lysinibacter cavernae]
MPDSAASGYVSSEAEGGTAPTATGGGSAQVEVDGSAHGVGTPLIRMMSASKSATSASDPSLSADAGFCADGVCSI